MKTYFKRQYCRSCGSAYDAIVPACPRCGKESEENLGAFARQVRIPWYRQLLLFLFGWGLFQLIAVLLQFILLAAAMFQNPGWSNEQLSAYGSSVAFLSITNYLSYAILLLGMGLLLWKDWKQIGASFKNWKGILLGLAGFASVVVFEELYGIGISALLQHFGIEYGSNANQSTLVAITQSSPILALLVFAIVGPFCEELAYRVGLFGLTSRINKPVAYILTILLFASIHFDFSAIGTSRLINELVNLPSYMVGAAVLCALYDNCGFASSFACHVANNLFSLVLSLLSAGVALHG